MKIGSEPVFFTRHFKVAKSERKNQGFRGLLNIIWKPYPNAGIIKPSLTVPKSCLIYPF